MGWDIGAAQKGGWDIGAAQASADVTPPSPVRRRIFIISSIWPILLTIMLCKFLLSSNSLST